MPRRPLTAEERRLFAEDPKLAEFESELKTVGAELGGELERKRTATERIAKLRAEIRQTESALKQANANIKGLRSRRAQLRECKRRRRNVVRREHYRDTVNPIRKELGLKPLKLDGKEPR